MLSRRPVYSAKGMTLSRPTTRRNSESVNVEILGAVDARTTVDTEPCNRRQNRFPILRQRLSVS